MASARNMYLLIGGMAVSIPLLSIYLGYLIGNQYKPAKNIMPDRGVVVEPALLNMSHYNTRHVTTDFHDGLGAQMFQYAALYGIAKANGLRAVMTSAEESAPLLSHIFPYLEAQHSPDPRPGQHYPKFREHKTHAFDQHTFSLNYMKDIDLIGSFQSWKYFDHVRREIRSQFSFSKTAINIVQEFLHKSQEQLSGLFNQQYSLSEYPLQFVGVHVRRRHLESDPRPNPGYAAVDKNYLSVAMQYYKHKYKNVLFVVASDDGEWSRAALASAADPTPVTFSTYEHPGLDLCLLSQCNHTVVTVGALGWWAAWLAGGEAVYYRGYPVDGSPLAAEFRRSDYYLNSWIAI